MDLIFEKRVLTYKGESIPYTAHLYLCQDSGEKFTTTDLDNINMAQVYEQYNALFGLTSTDGAQEIAPFATLLDNIFGVDGSNERTKYNESIERWLKRETTK